MGKKSAIHWAWIILATCFVNLFINYSVRLGYGVVLPEMIKDLGLNRTAGGTIYNAYLFSYITLTPLTGYLTDRFGARYVITTCTFILGANVFLMGTAGSMWMACLFYALVGLGATGMWTPIITVVQRWYAANRRGLALGILSTGYGLGAILVHWVSGILRDTSGNYDQAFIINAVIAALGLALICRVKKGNSLAL